MQVHKDHTFQFVTNWVNQYSNASFNNTNKGDFQSFEVLPCVPWENNRILSLYPVRSLFVRSSRCKPLRQVISSGSSDILLSRMSNTETDSKCCRCSAVILLIWLLPRWISCWSNKGYSLCLLIKTQSLPLHQNENKLSTGIPHATSSKGIMFLTCHSVSQLVSPSIYQSVNPSGLFFLSAKLLWNHSTEFHEAL